MKKICIVILITISAFITKAQIQQDPAHWAYGLKKLNDNQYEVHFQCTIDEGWHIYAQKQTKDFIGTRTKISIDKGQGIAVTSMPVELGKKETYTAKEVGITNYEYAGKVDFVQKVSIKPGAKAINGTITYQTCTHERCLTEKTINFSVPIP